MPTLGKLWAGYIYGTNTGSFFLEIHSSPEGQLTGIFRFTDNLTGLVIYRVTGNFDGTTLNLQGHSAQAHAAQGVTLGPIVATGTLTPEGQIRGTWNSSTGTAGTFVANPHDEAVTVTDQRKTGPQAPEQFYTSTINVGAVRIYAEDLWALIDLIRRDFLVGRPIITYSIRGNEVTKYLEDFRNEATALGQLTRLKLVVQEPEAHGINKIIVLELGDSRENEIRVQGINESWVIGKAEATARMIRKFQKRFITTFRKYMNPVIFFLMLVFIPSIPLIWQRIVFVLAVVLLLQSLVWLHRRFIPNATIYLGHDEPTLFQKAFPTILSWVVAVTAALTASWLFLWLTRKPPAE